jgi:MarR family transcriptional regulator for hemolysin
MLDVEPITLSRIVDRLEEASLVERVPDPTDRRAWRLQVTEKAEPLVAKLRTLGSALIEDAFEGIPADDLDRMRGLLAQVRENLVAAQRGKNAAEA